MSNRCARRALDIKEAGMRDRVNAGGKGAARSMPRVVPLLYTYTVSTGLKHGQGDQLLP
jgi:hypothetical protein